MKYCPAMMMARGGSEINGSFLVEGAYFIGLVPVTISLADSVT